MANESKTKAVHLAAVESFNNLIVFSTVITQFIIFFKSVLIFQKYHSNVDIFPKIAKFNLLFLNK